MSATACFLHAHAVSQGRFRCASRRARLLDTSHRRRLQTQRVGKAARGVLTTDAMNHLESFRSCISCCRLPAFAPIHSPCPEWSSATCPCNGPLHMFSTSCVMSCVSSTVALAPFASTSHATYSLSLSPNEVTGWSPVVGVRSHVAQRAFLIPAVPAVQELRTLVVLRVHS